MNLVNNNQGVLAVMFDHKNNPGLFKDNNSYILKKFELQGRNCALISVGRKVSLLSDLGMSKEKELLSMNFPAEISNHVKSFILKWYNNNVTLHADISIQKKINE